MFSSSARFYRDDDGILHISTYFLTKNKTIRSMAIQMTHCICFAMVQTVAFILHKDRLFTMRGEKLVAFRAFQCVQTTMTWTIKTRLGSY